jgi:Zn-dependent protease/predicted transcriptional regulator
MNIYFWKFKIMFGKTIPLFNLFGFRVGIDTTWFILLALITWSLAEGVFPHYYPSLPNVTYLWMGLAGALGLFMSIVFHEFCHSIVAKQFGMSMKGITLFIFGGVAEMSEEPKNARSEFLMAIAGPVSSVVLAGVFFLIYTAGVKLNWQTPVNGVIFYLSWINIILAGFNMIPAFPLDGGRVLRSILWAIKGNLRWATHISSELGAAFGLFLMVLGVINFIDGNFIGGLWYFLIGIFIRGASQTSYKQLLIKNALSGEPISRFMIADVITAPSSITVQDLIENYFYKHHYKMFPITDDGNLKGCVTTKQIKELPRDKWATVRISDIVQSCSNENTIPPDVDAMKAMSLMNRTGNSRLMITEGNKLLGVITLKDMLKFLALKLDLEGDEKISPGTDISD